MAGEPDADRPDPALGDCIAGVGAEVLEAAAARHGYQEPPDAKIDESELV